jgi:hypothetical protein
MKNEVNPMFVRELEVGDKVVHLQTLLYGRIVGKAAMGGIPNALLTVETACGKTLRMLRREEFGFYTGALPFLMHPAPAHRPIESDPHKNVAVAAGFTNSSISYEETSLLDEIV